MGAPASALLAETYIQYIVMCISIARQWVAKRIPATHVHTTIGLLLLYNGAVNMPYQQIEKAVFSMWSAPCIVTHDTCFL
jgi:hypothetical protein